MPEPPLTSPAAAAGGDAGDGARRPLAPARSANGCAGSRRSSPAAGAASSSPSSARWSPPRPSRRFRRCSRCCSTTASAERRSRSGRCRSRSIGLTAIRGLAGFLSQYGLAWAANRGTMQMRQAMFQRVLDAEPALFTPQHGEQPRQHPHLRGPERRDPARLLAAEPGRRLAPLPGAARLPGLAQLAADDVRRASCCRRSPT